MKIYSQQLRQRNAKRNASKSRNRAAKRAVVRSIKEMADTTKMDISSVDFKAHVKRTSSDCLPVLEKLLAKLAK